MFEAPVNQACGWSYGIVQLSSSFGEGREFLNPFFFYLLVFRGGTGARIVYAMCFVFTRAARMYVNEPSL